MKIAIVNDVHVGRPLMHQETIRAASDRLMSRFDSYLRDLVKRHEPDLIVNLGDLIRSESEEVDDRVYAQLMEKFRALHLPVIHLLGNHEIKRLGEKHVERLWQRHGVAQSSFGSLSVGDFNILWLGISELKRGAHRFTLPEVQIKWLKETLASLEKPALIFVHCAMDNHDPTGNFFYEAMDQNSKEGFFFLNQDEIREIILSSRKVLAVLQAHLHYFHTHVIDGVPFITCPAMGDNICAPDIQHNIPEISTILKVHNGQFTAKAYSREYCFAGYQQRI